MRKSLVEGAWSSSCSQTAMMLALTAFPVSSLSCSCMALQTAYALRAAKNSGGTKLAGQSPVGEHKHQQTSACGLPRPLAWGWWHSMENLNLVNA